MKLTLETLKAMFPDADVKEGRKHLFLESMSVDKLLGGIPLSFTRRRYPGMTYTWTEAFINGQWLSLGDPWPCLNPPSKALQAEIDRRQACTHPEIILHRHDHVWYCPRCGRVYGKDKPS